MKNNKDLLVVLNLSFYYFGFLNYNHNNYFFDILYPQKKKLLEMDRTFQINQIGSGFIIVFPFKKWCRHIM